MSNPTKAPMLHAKTRQCLPLDAVQHVGPTVPGDVASQLPIRGLCTLGEVLPQVLARYGLRDSSGQGETVRADWGAARSIENAIEASQPVLFADSAAVARWPEFAL